MAKKNRLNLYPIEIDRWSFDHYGTPFADAVVDRRDFPVGRMGCAKNALNMWSILTFWWNSVKAHGHGLRWDPRSSLWARTVTPNPTGRMAVGQRLARDSRTGRFCETFPAI